MSSEQDILPLPDNICQKAMSTSLKSVCFYTIGDLLYTNSFMLMYLSAMGISGDMILVYLSVQNLVYMALTVLAAHYSVRWTYVRSGVTGLIITSVALVLLCLAPFLKTAGGEWVLILGGMTAHGIGRALYVPAWYSLTATFVPERLRGRFFGNMRFIYQSISILFGLAVIMMLKKDSETTVFQFFLALAIAVKIPGIVPYFKLPPNPVSKAPLSSLKKNLLEVVASPGYMPFCAYTFLLMLATGSCSSLFCLLAKSSMGFSDSEVILTGNLLMAGSIAGFYFGGKMVDRLGVKLVFLVCHFSFGLILLCFLARGFVPSSLALVFIGGLSLAFGVVQASSSIALTSEMLGLAPKEHKSVAVALNQALLCAGIGLSGLLGSQAIKFRVLSDEWLLAGHRMGQYDTLILFCSIMVITLVVTLGLVPSVVRLARSASFVD